MTVSASPARRDMIQRILHQYLRPDWGRLVVAMICAAGVAAMSAGFAELMKPAVDRLFSHHDARALFQLPLAIAAVAVVRTLFQVFQSRIMNQVGHGLVGRIQVELFGHLIRADLQRLRAEHSGAYVSKVLFDATLMREAFTNGVVNYLQNALIVVGSVLVMLSRDVPLTLIVLLGAPIAGFTLRKFSKRTKKAAQGAMNETSTLSSAIMEGLDGVKIVKIENREAFEEKRVSEVISRRQAFIIKGANARANAAPITELITALITAAVFAYAGWRAQTGGMTVGSFIAFLGALTMAGQSLRQLANLQTVMSEGMTAAKRLFAALDIAPEVREQPGAIATERGQGALAIEDVSFSYADGAPALEAVSIVANPGETVALVGPSGGGKSTLLSLIPRFFDPSAGRITLDGVDVRHLTLASLRHHLALVTQEPFLFDDTIAANIAYGRPDATQEDIERAATAAAAHEFILGLSSGYQTQVGEAGARLSGGQRQRIAIARAFLKDAPILLLDEATSALDAESEARVQDALERLMKGRTTILIAHRLSTVQNADRIYVVDSGRVVESGRHSELIAEGGLYARLAAGQNLGLERSAS